MTMRALYVLSASLLLLSAHAQWPTTPQEPLVVCNHPSDQRQEIRVLPDPDGGWLVLWRDDREGPQKYGIYGQRIDLQGNLLWEENGRSIIEVDSGSISEFTAARLSNGNALLLYMVGRTYLYHDSVFALAIGSDGAAAWAEPTLVSHIGQLPIGSASYLTQPQLLPLSDGAYMGWSFNSVVPTVCRIANDGSLMDPMHGTIVNLAQTPRGFVMHTDHAGGLIIEKMVGSDNSPLQVQRVSPEGASLWNPPLVSTQGNPGLWYDYHSRMSSSGVMTTVWQNQLQLFHARYDTSGTMLTSTPDTLNNAPGSNSSPHVTLHDGSAWVAWADGRPPYASQQVHAQRYDANGVAQWITNGALVMEPNSNGTMPRFMGSENGTVILATVSQWGGFRAQRVLPDASTAWADTVRFCVYEKMPSPGTYALLNDGDGGVASVWFNWTDNAIYAARLDRNGRLGDFTSVAEHVAPAFSLFPNPAENVITLQSLGGTALGELRIHAADGRTVRDLGRAAVDRFSIDVSDLPAGVYIATIGGLEGRAVQRFVKQ
jgi:hypothetical protein